MGGYNFTEQVRRTLQAAREASEELRSGYVGPEHILMAALRHADRESRAALQTINADPRLLLEQFSATLRPGNETSTGPDLPYSAKGKRVLEAALAEAAGLRHSYVGTEHLLLGLASTPSPAADFLQQHGIDHARLRVAVIDVLGSAPLGPTVGPVVAGGWTTASTARIALIIAVGALIIAMVALMRTSAAE